MILKIDSGKEKRASNKLRKRKTKSISKQEYMLAAKQAARHDEMMVNATHKANMILTLMVLHDKFDFGGKVRIPRFLDEYKKLLDAYNAGYINVKDIESVLKEECGVEIKI